MRVISAEGERKRSTTARAGLASDSFLQDWFAFGLLAADLVGIGHQRLLDATVPAYEIAEHLTIEEARLLRGLVQLLPLTPMNGETVAAKIDNILHGLAAEVASRQAKLYLVVRLGISSPLTERIRQESDLEVEASDIEAQLQFVRDDLSEAPTLIAIRHPESNDVQLAVRGRNLLYRLQEFKMPRSTTSTWDFAYCERVHDRGPAPVNLLGQRLLSPESLEVLLLRDASERFPRLRGKLSSWEEYRLAFERESMPLSPEQTTHRALTLLQLLEALYAAADGFAVELRPVLSDVASSIDESGAWLCVRPRIDIERDALSEALELQPPAVRFLKALDSEGVAAEGWVLTDGRLLGDRSPEDTEWQFQRVVERKGEPDSFLFSGPEPSIELRDPVLFVASTGRDVQFRRRLKALKALKEHQELLRMIVDPRNKVTDSHDLLVEDAAFDQLDGPKKEALAQITSTLPLFLVQGPPGVGKTRLVRDLVTRRFSDEPTSRLLLTAQSNAAIDHLMDELQEVLQSEAIDAPLVVRSTKKDAVEKRSPFDIHEQTQRLVQRLADSSLLKELPTRLQRSVSDLARSGNLADSRNRRRAAISGRAAEQAHRVLEGIVARAANVVFATTNSAELERLIDERGQFDWAIVEEAGKATGSELISPLLLSHRRLMIGDHKQLPAFGSDQLKRLLSQPDRVQKAMKLGSEFIGRSLRDATIEDLLDEVEDDEEEDSLLPSLCAEALRLLTYFESAIEGEFLRQSQRKSGKPIAKKLTAQHRMHPIIAELVSYCFYGDLDTDPDCAARFASSTRPFHSVDSERLPMAPIVVVDMPYVQATMKMQQGDLYPAWHNPLEVNAAIEVLSLIRPDALPKAPTLAILSPYGRQRRYLDEAIREQSGDRLSHLNGFRAPSHSGQFCHTVDSFQGSEADIVVVSLVRNNHHSTIQQALGFLSDERRMNVLLSRAKWQLVLIASMEFLKEILAAAERTGDVSRIRFLSRMLENLASGEQAGTIARVPFDNLMKERK
ncbi:DEAD/DEAH box helicase [Paraburkholderia sp. ZP32-5]|uniref:DEAD/DEAH box helicase n=1 Tax=Paraburkholderia sp. ZP32-5 TaxID=2883245 RepID=UPI001F35C47A|nr:AAA domain-containing protein [Paraburkholderia sp. ZP32-5]